MAHHHAKYLNTLNEAIIAMPKINILIIEDQPEMAQAIRRVLKLAGYETNIASDGFHAGALLSSIKPALITLDLKMPGLDGFEVLDYIRSHPDLKHIKVLIVSAELDENLNRAIELGANDTLPKPFENSVLLAKVKSLVSPDS